MRRRARQLPNVLASSTTTTGSRCGRTASTNLLTLLDFPVAGSVVREGSLERPTLNDVFEITAGSCGLKGGEAWRCTCSATVEVPASTRSRCSDAGVLVPGDDVPLRLRAPHDGGAGLRADPGGGGGRRGYQSNFALRQMLEAVGGRREPAASPHQVDRGRPRGCWRRGSGRSHPSG